MKKAALKWILSGKGSSTSFQLTEVSQPEPAYGEVLIQVQYSGLNFADVMMYRGLYQDAPQRPFTPGYEVVGTIIAVGRGVLNSRMGETVLAFTRFGGFSSLVCVNESQAIVLPGQDQSGQVCALATAYSTAWVAMFALCHLLPGDRVLVPAATGGVGHGLLAFSRKIGLDATALVSTPEKAAYLRELGFTDVLVGHNLSPYITLLSQKKRFNAVFNAEGGKTVALGMKLLHSGGSMVCYGATQRLNPGFQLLKDIRMMLGFGFYHPVSLLLKSHSLSGLNMLRLADERPQFLEYALSNVVRSYVEGDLLLPVVEEFSAGQADLALARMQSRSHIGKIVLKWDL